MAKHGLKSNFYALQGKKGTVVKIIKLDQTGQIKIDGQIWSARSLHLQLLEPGALVEVIRVSGCHCIVKKY